MEDADEQEQIDNRYIIIKKLSFGGQAHVFLVKSTTNNNEYAAKIPRDEDGSFLDGEIGILQYLKENSTENIINIVDSGEGMITRINKEPENKKFLILEFAPKRDLAEYISIPKSGFGELFSKVLFYKIVKCIKSIHENQVCHRDIKLDNILFDIHFNPKITDFGIASHYDHELSGPFGTRGYMAPEIVEGNNYDGYKIDIFSLGVTLFILTVGTPGFTEATKKSYQYRLIKSKKEELFWKYFDIKERANENYKPLSKEFKSLYQSMVSYYPDDRPSIDDILDNEWFGDIRNMSANELEEYAENIKLFEELEKREQKIIDCTEIKIVKNNTSIGSSGSYRSGGDGYDKYFEPCLKPKLIEREKYKNYYIEINGNLNPSNFLNSLCYKIKEKFEDDDCFINAKKDKAVFDVEFDLDTGEEEIPEEIEKELEKLEIDKEENKEENKIEKEEENKLIIRIKLYRTSQGYLLRFVKKEGNKTDFIDKFEIISKLVQ